MILSHRKVVRIDTGEGLTFTLPVAGVLTRFLALIIDLACIQAVSSAVFIGITLLSILNSDWAQAIYYIGSFVLHIGYGIITEGYWNGQTLGKRLLHLRVVDAEGLKLRLSQVIIRNLLRPIDALPSLYLVGGLAGALSAQGQRLGDLAAGTIVIQVSRRTAPNVQAFNESKYNSFQIHPQLEARLRNKISAQESALIIDALWRRDELDAPARLTLFAELSQHIKSRVDFDPTLIEFLSEEQFLRNVISSIYRQPTNRTTRSV
jgi:uncharacterized RDD family membrane protein YckC